MCMCIYTILYLYTLGRKIKSSFYGSNTVNIVFGDYSCGKSISLNKYCIESLVAYKVIIIAVYYFLSTNLRLENYNKNTKEGVMSK